MKTLLFFLVRTEVYVVVEGKKIGTTLNKLEDEWIKNNFSLEEKKIMDIIKKARD